MGDVGEGAAMDEDRVVLERLHHVWHQRVLEQHGHGAVALDVAGADGLLVARVADDDVAEALLEILEVAGETEDRHHLGGDRDVEAVLAREAVRDAAERVDDRAQGAIVHIEDAAPLDAAAVEADCVAPIDVIVDQCREQVVGAEVMAWKSPVKWRLMSSMGTTWA